MRENSGPSVCVPPRTDCSRLPGRHVKSAQGFREFRPAIEFLPKIIGADEAIIAFEPGEARIAEQPPYDREVGHDHVRIAALHQRFRTRSGLLGPLQAQQMADRVDRDRHVAGARKRRESAFRRIELPAFRKAGSLIEQEGDVRAGRCARTIDDSQSLLMQAAMHQDKYVLTPMHDTARCALHRSLDRCRETVPISLGPAQS